MTKIYSRMNPAGAASMSALAFMLACPTGALAQTSAPEDGVAQVADAASTNDAEIVVTGSRIARRDFEADSPIVTVSEQTLTASSGTALEGKLNNLPQFTPGATRFATGSDQPGQATLNLRALGDFRTLVLVDGKRPQPGNARVTFDLNTLPSSVIGNVEIITGGASAVYGSDAIAGVVNLRTKSNFEGVEFNASTNITERGDGAEQQIGVLMGSRFADDRGKAMFAVEYTKRGSILERDRKFYEKSYAAGAGILASPYLPQGYYVPAFTNVPNPAVINSVFAGYGATLPAGGIPPVGVNLGFNNDGTLFTGGLGGLNYKGGLFPEYAINGQGNLVYNSGYPQLLSIPLERWAFFGNFEYALSDSIKFYAQANFTDYTTVTSNAAAPADGLWTINVSRDAAHPVPTDLATILDSRADPTAPFQIGKRLANVGNITVEHTNQVYQVMAGLKGSLGVGDLTWDIYGSHGRSQLADNYVSGAVVYDRLLELVARPNYGAGTAIGGVTCSSGIQLFGTAALSGDCIRAITAPIKRTTEVEQDIVEATVQGTIAELPAGRIGFAAGASYRKNSYSFTPDALLSSSQSSEIVGVFGSEATKGSTNVKELFAEVLIPIFRDSAFGNSFDVDLAYRYSDYNTAGGVHTYKASGNWEFRDFLRFRGGYQRAIRAPNVAELFSGRSLSITLWPDSDPCSNTSTVSYGNNASNPNRAQTRALCVGLGVPASSIGTFTYFTPIALGEPVGNPAVQEETADTYTLGFVLSPKFDSSFLRRLSLSVDFYKINVRDAIGTLPPAQIYARCFNGTGENPNYDPSSIYCAAINRDDGSTTVTGIATGIPTTTEQPYLNLGGFKTQGVDIQLDWGLDFSDTTHLSLNSVVTYIDSFKIQGAPGEPFLDYAGTLGNTTTGNGTLPKWAATSSATLSIDSFDIGGRWRWIDSMRYYTNIAIPGDTTAGTKAHSQFDLFGSVDVTEDFSFRFGVDNVTDAQPKVVGGVPGSTDPTIYDPIGRRYYAGIKAKF